MIQEGEVHNIAGFLSNSKVSLRSKGRKSLKKLLDSGDTKYKLSEVLWERIIQSILEGLEEGINNDGKRKGASGKGLEELTHLREILSLAGE